MGLLLDSNYLVDLLRGDASARKKAQELREGAGQVFIPAPAAYEVLLGVHRARSRRHAGAFRAVAGDFPALPFDGSSAARAAEIQAELFRMGRPMSHVDVMIAGIAAETGHRVVTRDRDFDVAAEAFGFHVERY